MAQNLHPEAEHSPVVSLVMTVYNTDAYLSKALDSLLAQTFQSWELILWDDGSTDSSGAIARTYAERDARIRFYDGVENRGQGKSLERAHALTRGEFVGWLDADDFLAPSALQETVECLQQHPQYGMVYTNHIDVDESGQALGLNYRCKIPYSPQRLLIDLLTFHFRLVRQTIFDAVDGFNLEIVCAEDYDLFLRISEITQIYHLEEPLYFYRLNVQGLSYQRREQQCQGSAKAVRQALLRRGLADTVFLEVDEDSGKFRLKQQNKAQLETVQFAKTWFVKGRKQMQQNNLSAAVSSFQQAIALRENYIAACNQLGKAYHLMGATEQAIDTFEKLLQLNPHLAQAHCNLGAIWQMQGDFERAAVAYRKAIALNPNLSVARLNLSGLLEQQMPASQQMPVPAA